MNYETCARRVVWNERVIYEWKRKMDGPCSRNDGTQVDKYERLIHRPVETIIAYIAGGTVHAHNTFLWRIQEYESLTKTLPSSVLHHQLRRITREGKHQEQGREIDRKISQSEMNKINRG